ncbi:GSCFA domain-containing protein [Telluribacter sp.]|jgi:lysophospholipase L1-like esterase|uniref:GSCFA domain-containing protein n=1 Tax=Telluribacter sp. TaxID=1978767 RepID=UPI002E11B2E8|nr:GSCFA domain-containing protein [Telluribacter sp.]
MKSLQLRTEVNVPPSPWKLSHQSSILTLGSCFAEVLGTQLLSYKFRVLSNPFGTVFNPVSVVKLLRMSLREELPLMGHFLLNNDGVYLHHDFHSSLWATDSQSLDVLLRTRMGEVKKFLLRADTLVLTLGTAYVYKSIRTEEYVSNCHKVPSSQFRKELLSINEITQELESLLQLLKSHNPALRVVLTVSPVRHTRDTLPLNQVSKSILRVACHTLSEAHEQVTYFPSYEIMIDDLRDYRFYEPDLIHPNEVAQDHIFRTFAESYMEGTTLEFIEEWNSVRRMREHRPQHGPTEAHRKLLLNLAGRLRKLSERVDVQPELREVEQELNNFPAGE